MRIMPLRGTCRAMGSFFQNQSHGAQGTHTVPRGLPLAHLPSGWSRMPSRGCPEAAGSVSRWWEAKTRHKNPPPQPLAASPSFWMPAPPPAAHFCSSSQVPHFKVAPEEFIKFQLQRFTTLNLHPSNTDISVAVAGVLNFFNCTTACLVCAKAECKPWPASSRQSQSGWLISTWLLPWLGTHRKGSLP